MKTPENVRKRKLEHLFNILDFNKNGLLQPDDFIHVAEKMSDILGFDKDNKDRLQLKFKATRIYIQMLTDMGKMDVSIDKDEWLGFFNSDLQLDSNAAKRYIFRTAAYIFMLFDQNGDKVISKQEFVDMFTVYQIKLDQSKSAFDKLDTNHDGQISMEEMIKGFEDYFLSPDPDAAGNWIFGDWRSENAA